MGKHVRGEVFPHPIAPDADLRPYTRAFTGAPRVHRAYVLDRKHGKIVYACPHEHRNTGTQERCAKSAVQRLLAQVKGEDR